MIVPSSELLLRNGLRSIKRSGQLPLYRPTPQGKEEVFPFSPPAPNFALREDRLPAPVDFLPGGSLSGSGEAGNRSGLGSGYSAFWPIGRQAGEDFLMCSVTAGSASGNHLVQEWVLSPLKGAVRFFSFGKPLASATARVPETAAQGQARSAPEERGPLAMLWRGAARVARSVAGLARPSGLGRGTVVLALGLLSGASASLRDARELFSASFGARPSADANLLEWSGEGEASWTATAPSFLCGAPSDETEEAIPPVERLGAGRAAGWQPAVKTLGQKILDALTGMGGGVSIAGATGMMLFCPRGLRIASGEEEGGWEGFSGSAYGSIGSGEIAPEESGGISIAEGEPLRAMVGAARTLSPEEEGRENAERTGGPVGRPAPMLILFG